MCIRDRSWMGLASAAPGADPRAPALTATAPSIKRPNMVVLLHPLLTYRDACPAAQSPKGDRQSGCCAIRRGSAIGSSHAARAAKDAGERPRVDLASPDARHATRVFSRTA